MARCGPGPYRHFCPSIPISAAKPQTRLKPNSPDQLKIGMPMQLDIIPFCTDENGDQKMTFAFSAVAAV